MPDYYYNKYILLWEFKQTGEVLRQMQLNHAKQFSTTLKGQN